MLTVTRSCWIDRCEWPPILPFRHQWCIFLYPSTLQNSSEFQGVKRSGWSRRCARMRTRHAKSLFWVRCIDTFWPYHSLTVARLTCILDRLNWECAIFLSTTPPLKLHSFDALNYIIPALFYWYRSIHWLRTFKNNSQRLQVQALLYPNERLC